MLFHRRDKEEPSQRNRLSSAAKVTSLEPEREDADSYTVPITYPDKHYSRTKAAIPSDGNVEEARGWVDFNTK